jgi:hypothetical protein
LLKLGLLHLLHLRVDLFGAFEGVFLGEACIKLTHLLLLKLRKSQPRLLNLRTRIKLSYHLPPFILQRRLHLMIAIRRELTPRISKLNTRGLNIWKILKATSLLASCLLGDIFLRPRGNLIQPFRGKC